MAEALIIDAVRTKSARILGGNRSGRIPGHESIGRGIGQHDRIELGPQVARANVRVGDRPGDKCGHLFGIEDKREVDDGRLAALEATADSSR